MQCTTTQPQPVHRNNPTASKKTIQYTSNCTVFLQQNCFLTVFCTSCSLHVNTIIISASFYIFSCSPAQLLLCASLAALSFYERLKNAFHYSFLKLRPIDYGEMMLWKVPRIFSTVDNNKDKRGCVVNTPREIFCKNKSWSLGVFTVICIYSNTCEDKVWNASEALQFECMWQLVGGVNQLAYRLSVYMLGFGNT